VVTVLLLAPVAACSSSSSTSPPTGIDQLVVPTPSPRPADFVTGVDNAWLMWAPGATTTWDSAGGEVTQQVSASPTPVAGLGATTLTTTAPDGTTTVDHFAQDRSGNVWWLGREGEWTAGRDGAQAGLWMPAAPRTGDGFRTGLAPGTSEDVAEVVLAPPADAGSAYDAENLQDGSAGDEVVVEVRTDLAPLRREVRTYVEGTGLTTYVVSGAGDDDTRWRRADPG
jgi:hypothetical protein